MGDSIVGEPIRLALYLKNLQNYQEQHIHRLKDSGFSVVVEGPDLQASGLQRQWMEFGDQLQILSLPLEEDWDILATLMRNLHTRGFTHLVSIKSWSEDLFRQILNIEEVICTTPSSMINLVSVEKLSETNNAIVQRLFDVDQMDYRKYKARDRIYPLKAYVPTEVLKPDPLLPRKMLFQAVRERRPIRNIELNFPVVKNPKPWWLRLKLVFYDMLLLSWSTLHRQHQPGHSALSFAAGLFVACTPLYGLQTLLLIGVAWFFRLSFPVAFLGSQISWPPTYALLVPLQIYIGLEILGEPMVLDGPWRELIERHFSAWAIGSLIVGGILAVLGGLAWYLVQVGWQKAKSN